ncbi:hypothetical protein Q3G72_026392 [Acer saccharum]|nr:hypothetical protein Q3G72_026392 [Acer saccharum]
MSNITSDVIACFWSAREDQGYGSPTQEQNPPPKKKRKQAGNPDPSSEVIALSPLALTATNRFFCEVRPRSEVIRKKVYVCPVPTCIQHNPARGLGNLTGIKKHGAKTWQCHKCSKMYAVQSDFNAHSKTCM